MPLSSSDSHVHHHGILAGVTAGTAAVLGCFLLVLGVWHRVSGAVADALTVLVWALVTALLAAALYAVIFLALRLRHHVRYPETLTRQVVRAEVVKPALPAAESPAVPPAPPVAALPSPVMHNWHLPQDPAAAVAVVRAIAEGGTDGEGE